MKLYAPSDYHQAKIMCAHGQKPEKKKQKGSQFLGEGSKTKGSFFSPLDVPVMPSSNIYTKM